MVDLRESYKSLHEALIHGGIANDARVDLRYISAEDLDSDEGLARLESYHGILAPDGFDNRDIEEIGRAHV